MSGAIGNPEDAQPTRSRCLLLPGGLVALVLLTLTGCGGGSEVPMSASEARNATPSPTSPTAAAPDAARTAASSIAPTGIPAGAQPATVERIIDGDTIAVRAAQAGPVLRSISQATVRLLEIDTPETVKPNTPVECLGKEASAYTAQLLPVGSRVWLVPDRERTDQYGRYLLYAWTDNGTFVNQQIIEAGFGKAVLYPPNDAYIEQLRAAEKTAKSAKRGVWGGCESRPTPQSRTTPTGRRYDSCSEVRAAGKAPLRRGQPGYGSHLDRDGDGVACEPTRTSSSGGSSSGGSGSGGGSTYYRNCSAARAAGAAPIRRGEPGYGSHLDRDHDGVACE